jgi:DNA/RNA endonuclease YhcR with UshA esterase domain
MKLPLRSFLTALSIAALFATSHASFAAEKSKSKAKPPIINCSDSKTLKAKIGKEVSVEGLVQSTGKGDDDGVRFLNLSAKPQTGFVAAVFPSAYKKLGPINKLEGKNIRVTGTLEKYKKQTQIKVTKASQVKVLPSPKAAPKKK